MTRLATTASLLLALLIVAPAAIAAPASEPTVAEAVTEPTAVDRLSSALADLEAWIGDGDNGQRWRKQLRIADLHAELAKRAEADPAVVARVLHRFTAKTPGLEKAGFAATRTALADWLKELKQQFAANPERLAWASRGDHQPISPAEFAAIQLDLRTKAAALEQALGRDTPLARSWQTFLQWDLLQPHLTEGFKPNRKTIADLDGVLARFHANEPGLELPVFTDVAKAIAHYRVLAGWASAAAVRDSRQDYEKLVAGIGEQLARHLETPTTETSWKAGRLLGIVDSLDQSPELVGAVRDRFARSNIMATVSDDLVVSMPEQRNFDQVRPVRDCILGTSIFGSARTLGNLRYELEPSETEARLLLRLDGQAFSNTRGYNGPVRINSTGKTVYAAEKRVTLHQDFFTSTPAVATVDTRTRINSIQKTGGQLGSRLIEKVAWKRAGQQKRQAELVSAEHTRERVVNEFNERAAKDLATARANYEEKIGDPLVRRGMSPEHIRLHSAPTGVGFEATFAGRHQLAAHTPAPPAMPGHDIAIQIHESAVNNYLPLALSSARIAQETADQEPVLKGNMPTWFKLTSVVQPKLAAAASAGAEIVEEAKERIEETIEEAGVAEPEKPKTMPFKPYSITLNAEAPVSVRFDDGKAAIRVRAAVLAADGAEYTNWDFIVTYQIIVKGDHILLKRVGDIEVFPTGFDPAWDKQLTAQQSGFRGTLAKNMNARAKAGQSFPDEIPIEPIRFSRFGVMVLRELVADDGWLTIGWTLPEAGAKAQPTPPPAPPAPPQGK